MSRTNRAPAEDDYLPVAEDAAALLKNPLLNKGSAFSREERELFHLHGLLPDHVATIEEQLERVRDQFDRKPNDMEKNIYLNGLMDRNETLFHRFVLENLEATVPIIYTPTVAAACAHWSRIYRRARGVYVTPRDRGRMAHVLRSRPTAARPVIVVTDNERILGIGDQGAGGMGIPIGKLALYTAAAGIHPARCLPISLDIGTNNPQLLEDPLYVGFRARRLVDDAYDSFIAEFVSAVREVYPGALLQWEDFSNRTSFTNLERYRGEVLSFNDDIQGTAAMVVAGLLAATRRIGGRVRDHTVVIVGAGSAGIGIRDQVAMAMSVDGADADDIARRIFALDSRGLLVRGRGALTPAKQRLAVDPAVVAGWGIDGDVVTLVDVVGHAGATVLVGVSGVPGVFDRETIEAISRTTERPIVLPLSNPTSHSEATPAEVLDWSDGRAIVATGSPFDPVRRNGETHEIGQANNVFIFPGIGLGALSVGARSVTDGMFLAAARALAEHVDDEAFKRGRIFPHITEVRAVSEAVAIAVATAAVTEGVADPVDDIPAAVLGDMWWPRYVPYRPK